MQKRAEKTRAEILRVAEEEFSEKGLYGSRIDEIAAKAQINKASIYKYFASKEDLYKNVLYDVYSRLGQLEGMIIENEAASYAEKMKSFISMYFSFLKENPTYVRMVMWENLNRAQYFRDQNVNRTKDPLINGLENLIVQAKKTHTIPQSLDAQQLILTLYACTFNYFSNMSTMSLIVQKDLSTDDAIEKRIRSVTEMLLSYMRLDESSAE